MAIIEAKKKRFLLACPQNDENDYLKAKNIMDYTRLNSILMGSPKIRFLHLHGLCLAFTFIILDDLKHAKKRVCHQNEI